MLLLCDFFKRGHGMPCPYKDATPSGAGVAVALARRRGGDREIAAALARKSSAEDDVAESLLVLGYALAATGDRAGARSVLEEGRAKAPARMTPQFDALLERLRAAGG